MNERAIPCTSQLEWRSDGNDHRLEGYAAVFGAESAPLPYIEMVHPGAFIRSLASPPNGRQTLVVDHDDSKLLASTATGRLHLAEDSTGLLVEGKIPDTTAGRDLRELGEAGEIAGMSFEFSATKAGAPFSADRRKRTLREVKLFHVTALTGKTPAYAQTTAAIRALATGLDVDFDNLGVLFDAVREGRKLDESEMGLLERVVAAVAPADSRWSSAASDASSATYALSTVLSLLGNETPDTDQFAALTAASQALQSYIASEASAIGTAEDQAASSPYRETPNLDAARALIAR